MSVAVRDEHPRNGAVGTDVVLEHDVRDAAVAERAARSGQHTQLRAFDVELHDGDRRVADDVVDGFHVDVVDRAEPLGLADERHAVVGIHVRRHDQLGAAWLRPERRVPDRDLRRAAAPFNDATLRSSTENNSGCGSHDSTRPDDPAATPASSVM